MSVMGCVTEIVCAAKKDHMDSRGTAAYTYINLSTDSEIKCSINIVHLSASMSVFGIYQDNIYIDLLVQRALDSSLF